VEHGHPLNVTPAFLSVTLPFLITNIPEDNQ